MTRIRFYGPSVLLLVTVLITMVAGPMLVERIAWAQADARVSLIKHSLIENPSLADLSDAFRKVAEAVEPSVVSIEVLARSGRDSRNEILEWWFGPRWDREEDRHQRFREDRQGNKFDRYNPPRPEGNGSGWVFDQQGHIVTNYHVIQNAEEIRVRFSDGAEYDASLIGHDPKTDVAILKVDADNLHPSTIAKQPVRQGEIVFAFGSPFRFEFSMSQGIVSATNRRNLGIITRGYEDFIQSDAAINPGNSGGPLTNIYGEVVGMNTAIASRNGVYNGLGFAIPVDLMAPIVQQIIKGGKVRRGFLGVYIGKLDPKLASKFGFEGKGVLVTGPTDQNSPAEQAGLSYPDIITHVNDTRVRSPYELQHMIANFEPGSEVELKLFRDGKTRTATVTLGELPSTAVAGRPPVMQGRSDNSGQSIEVLQKLGIEAVEDFSEQYAQEMGVSYKPGVLIRSIRRNSLADTEDLRPNMLITEVVSDRVESVDELVAAIKKHDLAEGILFRVQVWNARESTFLPRAVWLELGGVKESEGTQQEID